LPGAGPDGDPALGNARRTSASAFAGILGGCASARGAPIGPAPDNGLLFQQPVRGCRSLVALERSAHDQLSILGRRRNDDLVRRVASRRDRSRAVRDAVGGHERLLTHPAVARQAVSRLVEDHVSVAIDHLESKRERVHAFAGTTRTGPLLLRFQDDPDFLSIGRPLAVRLRLVQNSQISCGHNLMRRTPT